MCHAVEAMRVLIVVLGAALLAGCGGDESASQGSVGGRSASGASAGAQAPSAHLPPELARLESQANELIDGGPEAFEQRLAELDGTPVVVNKWASWCGPCRAEFPFFQSQAEARAGKVAFIGVNSGDNDGDAAAFLDEFPVPYPSYLDPDLEVAEVFNGVAAFPSTAFYDRRGELVYLKQGGYATEEQLADDIERYTG
jgi:cytochrome c biogenesis protein CcmG, thiol:disulfide interchange protein DsbE